MKLGAALRLLMLACVAMPACSGAVKQPLEQTVDETYTVDPSVKLSITNPAGTVRIYGSDAPQLHVQTIKKAYSAERLAKISSRVSVQPQAIAIVTQFPPTSAWAIADRSGTVDYTIVLPQTATLQRVEVENGELLVEGMREGAVHARVGTGLMFVRNCFSDADVSMGTGNLTLSYDWWEQIPFAATAAVQRGNVWTFLPGDGVFRLLAQALHGRITNDFAEQGDRKPEPARKIDISVHGGGHANLSIRADNGNIRVAETNP